MKKRICSAVMLLVLAMLLPGCGKNKHYVMTINIEEDVATVKIDNAKKDDFVSSGSITLNENDELLVEPNLEPGGKVSIKLNGVPEGQSIDTLPEFGEPALEVEAEGKDKFYCSTVPGEYQLTVTAVSKSSGSIRISVQENDTMPYKDWTEVESAEEAAKMAGLDQFVLPMDAETNLGKVEDIREYIHYRYQGNVVQADFPMAAADIAVRKGHFDIDAYDTADETVKFKHSWKQKVGDIEVKCYGNREGEAMKSFWKNGDYSYSINAAGAGGDDDFGLAENDVSVWVKGIK